MPGNESVIGEEGLRFFGTMTASISHELKNALSIINEGAGLLEDLAAMSARGMALDPARLVPLGEKIRRQVQRADLFIKRLNRFAHTIDVPRGAVDLEQMLRQACELAERFAAMREMVLEVAPPPDPVCVTSAPFLLQNVLWLCLDVAMQSIDAGQQLRLEAEKTDAGARIRIGTPSGPAWPARGAELTGGRLTALLEKLGADILFDEQKRQIAIDLPRVILKPEQAAGTTS